MDISITIRNTFGTQAFPLGDVTRNPISPLDYSSIKQDNYEYLEYLFEGNFPLRTSSKSLNANLISINLPAHKSLVSTDQIIIEWNEKREISVFEVPKGGSERQELFKFIPGNELPHIIDNNSYSEVMETLLNKYPIIEELMKSLEHISYLISSRDYPENLIPLLIKFFQNESIIPGIWTSKEFYKIPTDSLLDLNINAGLHENLIRKFVEGILSEMTGDTYKLICEDKYGYRVHLERNDAFNIPFRDHGGGVVSAVRYIPSLMQAIKKGDICFIGHDNSELLVHWHALMKRRFKEVYIPEFMKFYGKAPYYQIITY